MVKEVDGSRHPLAVGVPGDREVDLKRLAAQLEPAEAEPFSDQDFAAHPELVKGYLGPQILGANGPTKIKYLVDPRVVSGTRWLTGANQPGHHVFDLVCGRDFTPDGTIEAAEVREGDPAPDGSGPLRLARGIEMGHIFQLGKKYAEALGLKVLDQHGKLVTVTMGSYGVGVSRAVAAVAEGTADEKGLCWPRELAPYDVQLLATGKDEVVLAAAVDLAVQLDEAGVRVLLDDRKASPGVKFADAELMGMPTIVVVGRGLADGMIELRDRRSGEQSDYRAGRCVGRDCGGCARPPRAGLTSAGTRSRARHADPADRGGVQRRLGGRRCGRRRPDPAPRVADRIARQHLAGHHPWHQQGLVGLGHRDELDHLCGQDQTGLEDGAAARARLRGRIGLGRSGRQAVAKGVLHTDRPGRLGGGGRLHLAPAPARSDVGAQARRASALRSVRR